jgi:hypothetical protein
MGQVKVNLRWRERKQRKFWLFDLNVGFWKEKETKETRFFYSKFISKQFQIITINVIGHKQTHIYI